MASAQTAGELIARNNAAQGGGKLRSLKTARLSGKLTVAGTEGGPLLMEFVPPSHKVRMEVTEKGVVDTSAYDGTIAWEVKRSEDKTEPERLTGDALKDMKSMADFQGAIFDYEAKGNEIEYLGKAEIDGNPAYKLKLTRHDGEESTVFLDAKSYLEIREETVHASRSERTELVSTYGNFKTVDGVTLPCTIETTSKQSLGGGMIRMEGSMRIVIDKIELNVEIPESRFTKPKS
ncbi:MAG TPA: hypothetical protein VE075_04795 [Thermoanaerobaculia bacterium]|nr:hypothetical protein [Thermoanaerobaculia bacterium]